VHQDIDLPKSLPGAFSHLVDLFVLGDVARLDESAADRFGQRAPRRSSTSPA
jgi:hypothetical protein